MRWRSRLRTLRRRIPKSNRLAPVFFCDPETGVYSAGPGREFPTEEAARAWVEENYTEDDDPLFLIFEVETPEQTAARLAERLPMLPAPRSASSANQAIQGGTEVRG